MNAKGTQNNPYSVSEYQDLLENHLWEGGWVVITAQNIYITKKGNQEKDLGGLRLGSVNNPFSEDAYTEMHSKEQWPGGYVLFIGNTEPTYMRSTESEMAASCGCGSTSGSTSDSTSGSGSGLGCGLTAGKERFRPIGWDVMCEIEVEWGDGTFDLGQTPFVRATLVDYNNSPFVEDGSPIVTSWDGNYHVKIMYGTFPTIYYEIPNFYRC